MNGRIKIHVNKIIKINFFSYNYFIKVFVSFRIYIVKLANILINDIKDSIFYLRIIDLFTIKIYDYQFTN